MKRHILILLFILLSNLNRIYAQQPGDLDQTFGVGGISVLPFYTHGSSFAIQSDGQIVVSGAESGGGYKFAASRYDISGALDYSFGVNGMAVSALTHGVTSCIAIQSDGKIVVGGILENYSFGIVRFNADGTLDNSFGIGGSVATSFDTTFACILNDVSIQADGKIIAVGYTRTSDSTSAFGLIRYNTDGTLDNSFGIGGKVITSFGNTEDIANAVIIQPNGKIVVVGESRNMVTDVIFFAIARYNTDGLLDNSFDTDGKILTIISLSSSAKDVNLDIGGNIVVSGLSYNSSLTNFAAARYNTNGTLDNNFGSGGKISTAIGAFGSRSYSMAIQNDGKIILAGSSDSCYQCPSFAIIRYNTNGILDNTFGNNGKVITDLTSQVGLSSIIHVEIQSDGKILTGGGGVLVRYLSGLNVGIIDSRDEKGTYFVYPNPIEKEINLSYTLLQDEFISVRLIDNMGKTIHVFTDNIIKLKGNHEDNLILPDNLPDGIYNINILSDKKLIDIRIIK